MDRFAQGLAGISLLLAIMSAARATPRHPFVEGEPFPSLMLPSLKDGRPVSLTEFRGRKLVLHVFASW
jgi:hypothetical protein